MESISKFCNQISKNLPENIKITNGLGEGSYGNVYKIYDTNTNKHSALKVYKFSNQEEGIPATTLKEIMLLKYLNQKQIKNIVEIEKIYINLNSIYMQMEFCDSDLFHFIYQKDYSDEGTFNLILKYMKQILSATYQMHLSGVMHRDLKPANIFIKNGETKIGDFGLSRTYSLPGQNYSTSVCTLWYKAPELFGQFGYYSPAIDIWSIGCIFCEMLCKQPIFCGRTKGKEEYETIKKIIQFCGNFTKDQSVLPGNQFMSFSDTFDDCPSKDIFINALFNYLHSHSFFNISSDIFDLIIRMLVADPTKRISCLDALNHPLFVNII